MISYISGKLKTKKESSLILDVNGICYEVLIPQAIMKCLDDNILQDGSLNLVTYHYHQVEPAKTTPVLIGFLNEVEKEFFEKFITVSGVGPKAAVKALSVPISIIAQAIDSGNKELLKSLPGIGEQKAKDIIAKLQGKVGKFGLIQDAYIAQKKPQAPDFKEEALQVLLQLQYKKQEANEMLDKALSRNPDIKNAEELLNEVYKQKTADK